MLDVITMHTYNNNNYDDDTIITLKYKCISHSECVLN